MPLLEEAAEVLGPIDLSPAAAASAADLDYASEVLDLMGAGEAGEDLNADYTKKRNLGNRYQQDRAAMKAGDFTGIKGIPTQDMAMWESMGGQARFDRRREWFEQHAARFRDALG